MVCAMFVLQQECQQSGGSGDFGVLVAARGQYRPVPIVRAAGSYIRQVRLRCEFDFLFNLVTAPIYKSSGTMPFGALFICS